jgi:hypothetical protein
MDASTTTSERAVHDEACKGEWGKGRDTMDARPNWLRPIDAALIARVDNARSIHGGLDQRKIVAP